MVQGDPWRDASPQQRVDESVVELNTLLVYRIVSATERYNPRPSNGKSIGASPILAQQIKVLFKPVVVVARNISICILCTRWFKMAESVPNGFSAAALIHSTLNLVGSSGKAPGEVAGECRVLSHFRNENDKRNVATSTPAPWAKRASSRRHFCFVPRSSTFSSVELYLLPAKQRPSAPTSDTEVGCYPNSEGSNLLQHMARTRRPNTHNSPKATIQTISWLVSCPRLSFVFLCWLFIHCGADRAVDFLRFPVSPKPLPDRESF